MLAKFPSRGRPNSRAISESADEPQTLLRDRGIADGQSFFSLLAWESWSSPKAVTVVMSAAGANVTTATAFAFRSGTDGSEGHRAIADMRCWLAARVDRPLADDSPVQESAGSRQRLCEAAPQGVPMFLPATPCHSGDEFPMQRYEAVVGWPRFSLPTGENLPHYFMMSVFPAVGNTPSDCHAPHGYLLRAS